MNVLGIDPGLKGAIAQWDGKNLTLLEIPKAKSTGRGDEVLWASLNQQWDDLFFYADHVFLERVNARPKDGGSSAFKFGSIYGGLRSLAVAKLIPYTLVTPTVWMKAMGVGRGSKEASVIRAEQLFPSYTFRGPRGGKKDGVAEAALIAKYGFDKLAKDE
jgi:crossover junction endodeoxyribonuclease RuvC